MTMRPIHRETPLLPAHAVKTYGYTVPLRNKRLATKREADSGRACAMVDCQPYLNGWKTTLSKAVQPLLIKTLRESGRPFSAELDEGDMIAFVFQPGTPCFKASTHWVHTGDEDLHLILEGDWRGNPRGTAPRQLRAEDWLDDFATHQDAIASEIQKG
jgi:hypothetical protein